MFTSLLQKSKIRSYPADDLPQPLAGKLVTYYDHEGRKRVVHRDDWRTRILPRQLTALSDKPKHLRQIIASAIDLGCAADVLRASERLLAHEPHHADNHFLRCRVLTETDRIEAAAKVLKEAHTRHGRSAASLVELARILRRTKDSYKSQEALWEALKLDPNHPEALQQWAGDQKSLDGRRDALERAADMLKSWRARALVARIRLDENDRVGACEEYRAVLAASAGERSVAEQVSADLAGARMHAELVDLFGSTFDVNRHGPWVGLRLLEAYTALGDVRTGKQLLHTLFMRHRHELRDHLQGYANKFMSLAIAREKAAAAASAAPTQQAGMVSLVQFDMPPWWYGLRNPEWLCSPRDLEGMSVAFAMPACIGVNDSVRQVARGIPFYLSEALLLRSSLSSRVVAPIVPGEGLAPSDCAWNDDDLIAMCEGDGHAVDYVAGIAIEAQAGGQIKLSLTVLDVESRERAATFSRVGTPGNLATVLRDLEDEWFARWSLPTAGHAGIYAQPSPSVLTDYLVAQALSFEMYLGQRGLMRRPADQHGALDQLQTLARLMPEAPIAKLMMIAALNFDHTVGSDAHRDYVQAITDLLRDERDPASLVYRVSPLVLWVLGQDDHFEARRQQLLANAEPAYADWLNAIGREDDSFVVVEES